MDDDLKGAAALGVWTLAGSWAQAAGTDGHVPRTQLTRFLLNRSLAIALADLLVERRLWHSAGHDCPQCPQPEADGYVFHDWFQMRYDRATDVRLKRAKSKELKDPALIASVWARDCTDDPAVAAVGRCRYCQTELRKKDTRSVNRPQMDHVDPKLAVGVTNVVLSCGQCNNTKGQRTPEQAGMTLHPAPRHPGAAAAVESPRDAAPVAGSGPQAPAAGPQDDAVAGAADAAATAAERTPEEGSAETKPADQPGTTGGPPAGNAVLGRTRGRERAGRAGQGGVGSTEGSGLGSGGAGSPQGHTSGSGKGGRRRRGSRGRGRSGGGSRQGGQQREHQDDHENSGPSESPSAGRAGEAPEVPTGGRFGSPYFGWSGPPAVVSESICSTHGLDLPCRKCQGGDQS